MMWFDIIKAGIYYHVTGPEIANKIVEQQMIPAGNFDYTGWSLPWVEDQFKMLKLSPGIKLAMFFKDKQEAEDYLHDFTYRAIVPKGVILKCELETDLVKWPNDIAIHTPRKGEKLPPRQDNRRRFNTILLKSAYYSPIDEDIHGKFELIT